LILIFDVDCIKSKREFQRLMQFDKVTDIRRLLTHLMR
jgi:hypothetical protein